LNAPAMSKTAQCWLADSAIMCNGVVAAFKGGWFRFAHPPAALSIPARIWKDRGTFQMTDSGTTKFDAATFLANAGLGRRIVHFKAKEPFFTQGAPADCVFYIRSGRAKLTVVSSKGKEATITLLARGVCRG